jgi:hypothetical protein
MIPEADPLGPEADFGPDRAAAAVAADSDQWANRQLATASPAVRVTPVSDGIDSALSEPPLQRRTHRSEFATGIVRALALNSQK